MAAWLYMKLKGQREQNMYGDAAEPACVLYALTFDNIIFLHETAIEQESYIYIYI